jgi:uncharacterized SAM-binding protein YcdF (DUF218 family)
MFFKQYPSLLITLVSAENLVLPSKKILGLGWALFATILLAVLLILACMLLSQRKEDARYVFSKF